MGITRAKAWDVLCKYNETLSLRNHGLAVEGVMRFLAQQEGEDVEKWGIVGLLHDVDYEKFPEQHCVKAVELLREEGFSEDVIHAVISHGWDSCTDVMPQEKMEWILYTIDELTGLIGAAALMRPSKSVMDIEVKSVKKKFKDKKFAAGVDRNIILFGCEKLGWELDEAIEKTILGMRTVADDIGLGLEVQI